MLAARLGELEPATSVELEDVELPPAQSLPPRVIEAAGGDARVSSTDEDRVRHAAGSGYPDLIRLRSGTLAEAPDAVLAPPDADAVAATLAACARGARRGRPLRRRHQRGRRRRAGPRRLRAARHAST